MIVVWEGPIASPCTRSRSHSSSPRAADQQGSTPERRAATCCHCEEIVEGYSVQGQRIMPHAMALILKSLAAEYAVASGCFSRAPVTASLAAADTRIYSLNIAALLCSPRQHTCRSIISAGRRCSASRSAFAHGYSASKFILRFLKCLYPAYRNTVSEEILMIPVLYCRQEMRLAVIRLKAHKDLEYAGRVHRRVLSGGGANHHRVARATSRSARRLGETYRTTGKIPEPRDRDPAGPDSGPESLGIFI